MSTDVIDNNVELELEGGDPTSLEDLSSNYTEDELRAMEKGWKPLEEFSGNEDDFVSAKEFLKRGSYFEKINKQKVALSSRDKVIKELAEHNKSLMQAAYKKAIADIKTKKIQALEEDDYSKQLELDEELETLKDVHNKSLSEVDSKLPSDTVDVEEFPTAYLEWEDKNPWAVPGNPKFDAELASFASALAATCRSQNKSLEDALEYIDSRMRKAFPEKFNVTTKRGSPVEGKSITTKKPTKSKGTTLDSLSREEQAIAYRLIEATGMSEEDYMKQYNLISNYK